MPTQLLATRRLSGLLPSTRPRASSPGGALVSPAPLRWPPMRTVLVVDDEPKIVQLARDYLEHAGFAVLTAADGRAARRDRAAPASRPGRPRPRPARPRRPRRHPRAAPRLVDPDRDADRPRRRARQAARPRARRRRLPDQAVLARASWSPASRRSCGGPSARPSPATSSAPATSSSTCRGCGPRSPAEPSTSPRPSSGCWPRWPPAPAGSSPGPSCSTRCAASPSSRTSGRSTRTSRTCAARSSPTRASRATC